LSLKVPGKMEKDTEEVFFVEVREPNEVRRYILESLKDIVESLQRFEKFKEIRKEKMHNINKLRGIVKGLNKHISSLKNSLPESKLRVIDIKPTLKEEHKPKAGKRKKQKKEEEEVEERKPTTELERLEAELGAIEDKLGSLR